MLQAPLHALAPAKVNLGLRLGGVRSSDARHELVSVMQSVSLADELTLEAGAQDGADAADDELVCAGVEGDPRENLAARALACFRSATGWDAPPVRLTVLKRIPLAAGLAGGSADAAATLRLARAASGRGDDALLHEIAASLGADVPAQLSPGRWLASGAGERLQRLPAPAGELWLLLLPARGELSTAAVYREADRLALAHAAAELDRYRARLEGQLAQGAALPAAGELLQNDLEPAALSLFPAISEALAQARVAGAPHAFVCGSGPTVAAAFAGAGARALLEHVARQLQAREPAPIACRAVSGEFGAPRAGGAPPRA